LVNDKATSKRSGWSKVILKHLMDGWRASERDTEPFQEICGELEKFANKLAPALLNCFQVLRATTQMTVQMVTKYNCFFKHYQGKLCLQDESCMGR
jgi:hypothetical protein